MKISVKNKGLERNTVLKNLDQYKEYYDVPADAEILISACYTGIGIQTEMGIFGIAQRDGGIEVMLNGQLIFVASPNGIYACKAADIIQPYSAERQSHRMPGVGPG